MRRSIGRRGTVFLLAFPFLLLIYDYVAAFAVNRGVVYAPSPVEIVSHCDADGAKLYMQNCARCHGERGNANGATSPFLDPPARRFGAEKFQLATSNNKIPTDDDLLYLMKHGIPGTAMPAFDQLTATELNAIARHVRWLTHAGYYSWMFDRDKKQGDEPDVEELSRAASKEVFPGEKVELPLEMPPATPESIERGKKVFGANCATCHGPEGKGDGPQVKDMKNDDPSKRGNGRATRPRDLARGVFKGGAEPDRLYARLLLGLPGTPMPEMRALKPNEIGDMVNFVLSLSNQHKQP